MTPPSCRDKDLKAPHEGPLDVTNVDMEVIGHDLVKDHMFGLRPMWRSTWREIASTSAFWTMALVHKGILERSVLLEGLAIARLVRSYVNQPIGGLFRLRPTGAANLFKSHLL